MRRIAVIKMPTSIVAVCDEGHAGFHCRNCVQREIILSVKVKNKPTYNNDYTRKNTTVGPII